MEVRASNGVIVKLVLLSELQKRVRICAPSPLEEMEDELIIKTLEAGTEVGKMLEEKGFIVEY